MELQRETGIVLSLNLQCRRKRREDGGPEVGRFGYQKHLVYLTLCSVETVEEQIVRNLSEKRIKEIDQTLSQIKEEYM